MRIIDDGDSAPVTDHAPAATSPGPAAMDTRHSADANRVITVAGRPTTEDVAVVVALLVGASRGDDGTASEPARTVWADHGRRLGVRHHGPHAWRWSA